MHTKRRLQLNRLDSILSCVPPEEWLQECKTPDQQEKWKQVKFFYDLICKDFHASIRGEQSPLDKMDLDRGFKEYIRVRTRAYKSLFDALWEGWSEVSRTLQETPPEKANVSRMPKSPGETVFVAVWQDARMSFRRCLQPYAELRASGITKAQKRAEERERLMSLPSSRKTEKKLEALKKQDRAFLQLSGLGGYQTLQEFYMPTLEKKFKGDRTEHPLKAYRRHEGDLKRLTLRLNHQRQKRGGERWKNGILEIVGEGVNRYNL